MLDRIAHALVSSFEAVEVKRLRARLDAMTAQQIRFAEDVRTAHRLELQRRDQLEAAHIQSVLVLAAAVEARDGNTGAHVGRVTELALTLGRHLGLGRGELDRLRIGAALHDVGKIAIPDAILQKPGPLDERERAVMETHVTKGAELIEQASHLACARDAVLHHHERWDGAGYPFGLAGPEIPLHGRIVAVADAFDAMTSDRPYRQALPRALAAQVIRQGSGGQFDPEIAECFAATIPARLEVAS